MEEFIKKLLSREVFFKDRSIIFFEFLATFQLSLSDYNKSYSEIANDSSTFAAAITKKLKNEPPSYIVCGDDHFF